MKKISSFLILVILTSVVFACVTENTKNINQKQTVQQNGFDIFSKYSSN